ncbi:DUF423 domain-containing protein [Pseudoxanthomonas kaohsiungensis]|jgi:uncharacterized membrane protein YgdD (TMEM256/DUF423 family)|uniref:DUF423 domain-containing protein n=1 Tax=Pseudoxanthomonas kaohsiungensis TaxID=283923 RepID=A0ABW3LWK9_9GAMM|nr:DUF423 domain-containing protein [Pseudoxanthomonas kaohsiungensis]KAF1701769.1 hypothetical protein CSC66_12800 [Pseudoxanthomonas kaohsiungensis]
MAWRDGGRTGAWLAAAGAVLAALAVGLSAYAAHGVADAHARGNLQLASLYAFGHGIALAALAPAAARRVPLLALAGLLAGTLLFAGSLAFAALLGWPTRLAPLGGTVLMASWLLYAVGVARR